MGQAWDGQKTKKFVMDHVRFMLKPAYDKVNQLNQAVVEQQAKFMHSWNALNVFVRMFEKTGDRLGWWAGDEFKEQFAETARELFKEGLAHQQEELARMRDEQRGGKKARPMTRVAEPMDDLTGLLPDATRVAVDAVQPEGGDEDEIERTPEEAQAVAWLESLSDEQLANELKKCVDEDSIMTLEYEVERRKHEDPVEGARRRLANAASKS